MAGENLSVPPRVGSLGPGDVTLEAELVDKAAEREIEKAVWGRRGIARRYVMWVRRRNPDATPAEIISMLERHYVTAISVAGAAITVGSIAGELGIAMIPVGGSAAAGAKAVAKQAGKKAAKSGAQQARHDFPPELSNSSSRSPRSSPSRSPTSTEWTSTRSKRMHSSTLCRTAG
jgi:hypothetical protein